MKTKVLAILLTGLLGLALSSPSAAFAGSKGNKSELRAKLVPAGSVLVEDFDGKVKYKKKASKKGSEEEIEAKVESELPNPTLGINDENSAADASFLLRIFQGTTTTLKGTCILLIKEIEFEYEGGTTLIGFEAEYAAKVKEKTPLSGLPTLSKKVGTCQVLPAAVDGIPDVVIGDTAAIYDSTGSTLFLSGVFQSGKHDDDDHDDDDDDEDDDD
jgi:hypothetical protein